MNIKHFSSLLFCVLFGMIACTSSTADSKVEQQQLAAVSRALIEKAAAIGRVPTSIEVNFGSGYWHIASGFNVDSIGDFRAYDGTWIQFKPHNELVWGRNNKDLGSGAWGWNEDKEYLTMLSDTSDEFFFGEWKTNSKGDVYVCVGSTPNNPRSTQFKIVRRQSKTVSE